jgi:hypothetical protein
LNAARFGQFFFVALVAAIAAICLIHFPSESGPTRWHNYLWRNDARLFLAWASALPLLWGLANFSTRPLIASASTIVGIGFSTSLVLVAPSDAERLFAVFTEPTLLILIGYCGLAAILRWAFGDRFRNSLGLLVFAMGFGFIAAAGVGWNAWITRQLPPNYHDEYAYLFQAWTFLSGRVALPADHLSPAFEQVHILNDGVFASRYFPGTALWLAPFAALRLPILAMWTAHALATAFFSLVAERLHRGAGWLTALLVGSAPGMIVFSDSILSTMPTIAAFGLFLWAWLSVHERPQSSTAILAGAAVGFAFLCRPLTAVGLGFSFALYSLYRCWKPRMNGERRCVAAMATAFFAVAVLLPVWSYLTLGAFTETPYSRYTNTRTPSHVYGFYNVDRAKPLQSEKTFAPYDAWATNLMPDLAIPTLLVRIMNLLREGVAGLAFSTLFIAVSLVTLPRRDDRYLLLWLSMFGLALAYAPYWFIGVFGFGYLAEALPFLLVVMATAAMKVGDSLGGSALSLWKNALTALVLLRVVMNAGDVVPRNFDPSSDNQFARWEKKQIVDRENAALRTEGRDILVLIEVDPKTAVHSTLVNNHPRLDGPVVRALAIPELKDELMAKYPDRAVYLLEYKGFNEPFNWRRLRGPLTRRR